MECGSGSLPAEADVKGRLSGENSVLSGRAFCDKIGWKGRPILLQTEDNISVLDKVLSNYSSLFEAEKKVADFVLDHSTEVIDMTVAEVANDCSVSEATVIRFCKRCGCQGFHRLKLDLARESDTHGIKKDIPNELHANDIGSSIRNILANKQEELQETLAGIDPSQCDRVLNLLQGARTVVFSAVGNTIPIALDGAYKFNELGITSFTSSVWENMLAMLRTLPSDAVMIALSASGESKHLLYMVDCAVERKIPIIAVTNHIHSSLAKKSTYVLRSVSRERMFFRNHSFLSTRLSMMAVVEILYFLLCSRKEDSFHCIDVHEQSIADEKM